MKIHNEGFKIIILFFLLLAGLDFVFIYFIPIVWIWSILLGASIIFFFLIVSFFRELLGSGSVFGFQVIPDSFYAAG